MLLNGLCVVERVVPSVCRMLRPVSLMENPLSIENLLEALLGDVLVVDCGSVQLQVALVLVV